MLLAPGGHGCRPGSFPVVQAMKVTYRGRVMLEVIVSPL